MSGMGFYVSPEQLMRDRADYANKGIARGRSVTVIAYQDGILLSAQNPSRTLHKISEIYDRIAFAGVGKYSEFDQLRIAGIRHADLKGYSYSREDVDARGLANVYAQYLNQIFIHDNKPMEIEIVIAEVGNSSAEDEIFHVLYDGSVNDEQNFTALGGQADPIKDHLKENFKPNLDINGAIALSVAALSQADAEDTDNSTDINNLEIATIERNKEGRVFRRLADEELQAALK